MRPTPEELAEKERRVRQLMAAGNLDALLIGRQDNFAWITGGGSNFVSTATEVGVASILVTADGKWLLCDNIEQARVLEEELAGLGFASEAWQWWTGSLARAVEGIAPKARIGSDIPLTGAEPIAPALARCRWSLLEPEVERYRWLGQRVGEAIAETCRRVRPGMTEWQVAGSLGGRLIEQGIVPTVLLVAADERACRYRHPIPTDRKVEKHAMVVVCGRRWGLIVSATRIVHFGQPGDELAKKHRAVVEVDAAFITATRPGAVVGEIFRAGQQAYARTGFAEEWKHHHQGGPTGYAGREFRATPESKETVLANQAFAWNPSIAGTKSEDTIIATDGGPEILSLSGGFPTLNIEAPGASIPRPDILVL